MNKDSIFSSLKDFYFPIFVVLLVLLLSPVFLIPKIKKIPEMRKTIVAQEKESNQLSQKLSDLESLDEAELFNTSSLLLEALPAQKDFYQVLTLSKKVFSDNGSFLKSFDSSPGKVSTESAEAKKEDSPFSPMQLKISFSASYDNFSNLLISFSKTLPIMEVDAIDFSSVSATSSANFLDLEGTINLKSYFAPLPKTIGRIDSPLPKISSQGKSLTEELETYQRYKEETAAGGEPMIVGKENPFP